MGVVLRQLGLPGAPPNMLRYLGHPREPDLLDRPFAFGDHSGTVRELWPLLCTEQGIDAAPAIGSALAAVFEATEMPQALDLCTRENVPWGFTSNASLLHFAVASGPAAIAPSLAALQVYRGRGPVGYWDSRDMRRIGTQPPIFLWVALGALDPSAERPRGLTFDGTSVMMTLRHADALGPQAAAWARAALP